jgi:hypothetical protein
VGEELPEDVDGYVEEIVEAQAWKFYPVDRPEKLLKNPRWRDVT